MNYYFDTCIWIDFFEDRRNLIGKNLGKPAYNAIFKIINRKDKVLISDITIHELSKFFGEEYINQEFAWLYSMKLLTGVRSTPEDCEYAEKLSKQKQIPFGDSLHAILAKKNNAIIVTRDKHFELLKEFAKSVRPEEL